MSDDLTAIDPATNRMFGLGTTAPAAPPGESTPSSPSASPPVSGASEMERIGGPDVSVPERPSQYRILTLPGAAGGAPAIGLEHVEQITNAAHEAGLSQGELDRILFARHLAQHAEANGARVEQASRTTERELRARWGADYDARVAIARAESRRLSDSSDVLRDWFRTTLGSNRQVIETLYQRGVRRAAGK